MVSLTVRLRVPVQAGWRQRDVVQVFGDDAEGVLDTGLPLLSRPVWMFPADVRGEVSPPGWCQAPWGSVPWGGAAPRVSKAAGWGQHPWCSVPWCGGSAFIELDVRVRQEFRVRKFAVQAVDGAGNPQGALVEFTHLVSGEDPAPLTGFRFAGYHAGSDVATFSFEE